MPTTPSKCRKMLRDGIAEKKWTKEGIFYIQMLIEVGSKTQDVALAIDPGSKFDGYCVSGEKEIAVMGMAVLPDRVHKRMETRKAQRRNRRSRGCRRRKARFDNRKRSEGWIAPSQLAKVQLRIRLMERMCKIFPINNIVIEDVRFNHYKKRYGKYFSTVEIGKAKVYAKAKELAKLWLCEGWETAETRKAFGIKKCSTKSKLVPEAHANDALAMICWLYGDKPETGNTDVFYIWRKQECSRRQLHLLQPSKGGKRRRYGGTTNASSKLRKGDAIRYKDSTIGYVGGWTNGGNVISLVNGKGKRIRQAGKGTIEFLFHSPNILTERRGGFPPPSKGGGVQAQSFVKKLNIDNIPIQIEDKCSLCGIPLVRGLNFNNWYEYKMVDGVQASVPICNKCAKQSNSVEKEL